MYGDGYILVDGYFFFCLIYIGEFEIEFFLKFSKFVIIFLEVRNNMLLVIFFIRVRIFFRDLNFLKFFKVFFLVCIFKIKIIFRIVILLF